MPNFLSGRDEKLSIKFNGSVFVVENLTEHYIELETLSFYYDSKIVSLDINKSLPPLSVKNISNVRYLNIDWDKLSFDDIDKDFAKNHRLEYGLALKYQQSGSSQGSSLFSKKSFSLIELI